MKVIYTPKGKAREYAELALNYRIGCDHGCSYCYGPNTMHIKKENWLKPRERNILSEIESDATEMEQNGDTRSVLLMFASDPYCHQDCETHLTRKVIEIFLKHNIHFTILTKGGMRSLADLDLLMTRPDLVTYATTLVFTDEEQRKIYEPNAAPTTERYAALGNMNMAGIPNWVSLEPVFDPEQTFQIIRDTHLYVDLYKVGKLNYMASDIDWRKFKTDVIEVFNSFRAKYILKESLRNL